MIPAVPAYIGNNFNDTPPGHRFGLYFPIWNEHTWGLERTRKSEALRQTLSVPAESRKQIEALRTRQQALVALAAEDAKLSLEAESISPLATGMGMEHPLENGFAFLNPYGLPYLPGSSIKGVLRRAAEELTQENQGCWNETMIDALFGHEDSNNASRGTLTFWDAIPELAGNTMGMDVMTPHYGEYYQDNGTPHDAGSPNPIVFMVVPAKSKFSFHVTADISRLKDVQNWKALMQAAFAHAFKWLGFGAKTSVGYGAMRDPRQGQMENSGKVEAPKPLNTQTMEGYLKLNPRNKSLFLEHSRKILATATTQKFIGNIRKSLGEDQKKLDAGQGIKVVAQVDNKEIVSVELWKG
jgi:CRISPR-associated protein Cmr6